MADDTGSNSGSNQPEETKKGILSLFKNANWLSEAIEKLKESDFGKSDLGQKIAGLLGRGKDLAEKAGQKVGEHTPDGVKDAGQKVKDNLNAAGIQRVLNEVQTGFSNLNGGGKAAVVAGATVSTGLVASAANDLRKDANNQRHVGKAFAKVAVAALGFVGSIAANRGKFPGLLADKSNVQAVGRS